MDINDLRGISTAFLLVAFIGLVIWAYSKKRRQEFDEAANLPFADEDDTAGAGRGDSTGDNTGHNNGDSTGHNNGANRRNTGNE